MRRKLLRIRLFGVCICTWLTSATFGDDSHVTDARGCRAVVASTSACDPDQLQDSGAVYRICMPDPDRWNDELVVYAHGYVAPNRPLEIPEDQLGPPGSPSLAEIANILGFGFATTSYSTNGLAVREGLDDLIDLVDIFIQTYGEPTYVYLVGGSEGGLITTLAIEQHADVFDGGLAACGPIGDFRYQLDYIGHFRVVFDYLFPDVLPGSAVDIPQELIDRWDSVYVPIIQDVVISNPEAIEQLLHVTGAPIDWRDPSSVQTTVLGLLWYNVHATNDAVAKLGGQPFDNMSYRYKGLTAGFGQVPDVERTGADIRALEEIELYYQASGYLARPLVTLHTTRDPIVPYWHERLYHQKVADGGGMITPITMTVPRHGHCNFTAEELLKAFAALVQEVRGAGRESAEDLLQDWMSIIDRDKSVRDRPLRR